MSGTRRGRRLEFSDHHRQRYADRVRIPDAGEFLIGVYNDDGSVDLDGEFRVTLVELDGIVYPRLEAYGEAAGALQRALDGGLLDVLGPVAGRNEFAGRLLAIGMADRSDTARLGSEG